MQLDSRWAWWRVFGNISQTLEPRFSSKSFTCYYPRLKRYHPSNKKKWESLTPAVSPGGRVSRPLWVLQRSSEGYKRRKGGRTPHRIPFLSQCSQTAPIASFLIFGVLYRRHLKKKKKKRMCY